VGSKLRATQKRAWYVRNIYDDDHEHDEIIYATARNKAIYQSEGLAYCQDWTEMRASRAPEFDKFAPDDAPGPTDLEYLERGWSVYCHKCNGGPVNRDSLEDEEGFADEKGRVYCAACWHEQQVREHLGFETVAGVS
jgi:hypothetical protein